MKLKIPCLLVLPRIHTISIHVSQFEFLQAGSLNFSFIFLRQWQNSHQLHLSITHLRAFILQGKQSRKDFSNIRESFCYEWSFLSLTVSLFTCIQDLNILVGDGAIVVLDLWTLLLAFSASYWALSQATAHQSQSHPLFTHTRTQTLATTIIVIMRFLLSNCLDATVEMN